MVLSNVQEMGEMKLPVISRQYSDVNKDKTISQAKKLDETEMNFVRPSRLLLLL